MQHPNQRKSLNRNYNQSKPKNQQKYQLQLLLLIQHQLLLLLRFLYRHRLKIRFWLKLKLQLLLQHRVQILLQLQLHYKNKHLQQSKMCSKKAKMMKLLSQTSLYLSKSHKSKYLNRIPLLPTQNVKKQSRVTSPKLIACKRRNPLLLKKIRFSNRING